MFLGRSFSTALGTAFSLFLATTWARSGEPARPFRDLPLPKRISCSALEPVHIRESLPLKYAQKTLTLENVADPAFRHVAFRWNQIEIPRVRRVFDSIVGINGSSGVLISSAGHIRTADHVLRLPGSKNVQLKTVVFSYGGMQFTDPHATSVWKEAKHDGAIVLASTLGDLPYVGLAKRPP